MNSFFGVVFAILALITGGLIVIGKKNKQIDLYKQESEKQAVNYAKEKVSADNLIKEKSVTENTAKLASGLSDSVSSRNVKVAKLKEIIKENDSPTQLSDKEKEIAKKIISDSN